MAAFDESKQGYPCNTCAAIFSSVDKVKSHYKGDWHVFNSKRRAHELVPLSKADFKAIEHTVKKPASSPKKAAPAKKEEVSHRTMKKLVREGAELPKEKVKKEEDGEVVPLTWGGITADTTEEMVQIAKGMGIGADRMDSIVEMAVTRRDEEIQLEEKYREKKRAAFLKAHPEAKEEEEAAAASALKEAAGEEGEAGEEEEEEYVPETRANASIFDRRVFDSTDEAVVYMREKYGFFLPDQDILHNRDGLLEYLNEKVKLGGYCLFCQRQFIPGKPCQQHMIDRGQ